AVHLGLPVITFRNAWTMPQERYNTDWVQENDFGRVIRSSSDLRAAVDALLADLPRHRAALAASCNRAVFEVPAILARILQGAGGACEPRHAGVAVDLA
ncbi:MAG: galactosyldiacylglycerol synthase, partial [Burkholderiaceae bacterium]|nr:galactosyldiacylglycerol synthase [Burkholderiaceae bacterium]